MANSSTLGVGLLAVDIEEESVSARGAGARVAHDLSHAMAAAAVVVVVGRALHT